MSDNGGVSDVEYAVDHTINFISKGWHVTPKLRRSNKERTERSINKENIDGQEIEHVHSVAWGATRRSAVPPTTACVSVCGAEGSSRRARTRMQHPGSLTMECC